MIANAPAQRLAQTAPGSQTRRRFFLRLALAAKLALSSMLFMAAGGAPAQAQVGDSPATFFRLDRQRMQNRGPAARQKRTIIQRPTRLIRGARAQRGFSRVVPAAPIQAAIPPSQAPGQPPAPQTGADPATPPVQSAAISAAPPPAALPPATPPSAPAGPQIRIVVLGDNIGQMLARGLETTFAERPDIAIVRQTRDSSGLVNSRFHDWIEASKALLAGSEKIDIAVMMLGSNDNQELVSGSERLTPRSEAWAKIYKQRIEAIAAQFRARNVPLIWVGQPVMRNNRLSETMLALNEFYREAVTRAGGVYVDVWEAFIDDRNRFTLFGPNTDGQIVKLRTDDGVHFTRAGSRKLAHFTEAAIRRQIDTIRRRQAPPALSPAIAVPSQPETTPAEGANRQAALPQSVPPIARPPPEPVRPSAGPVLPLLAPEAAPGGELVTRRAKPAPAAKELPSSVRRALTTGVPGEAPSGRADDFSWPKTTP